MHLRDSEDVAPDLAQIAELLPPGSEVRPRYRAIARQLLAWKLPGWLPHLALILRPVERGRVAPERVAALLGPEAAEAATALAALGGPAPRQSLQAVERPWKLFVLLYRCPPAALLKIAELLVQLRETQDTDIDVSPETISAAAHASARLGMWDVRRELRDRAARLSDPRLAQRAQALVERTQPARDRLFAQLRHQFADLLAEQGITAIVGRRQRPIYQLMAEELESLRGPAPWADEVEVLVDRVPDCYRALGALNSAYRALSGARVRDYIGGPRENGYQSIQTVVECTLPSGERLPQVTVHIATAEMARFNRQGLLAHLAGAPVPLGRPVWWADRRRRRAALEDGELFAFTPKGEVIVLPPGATVLDFAVRVHLDLGVHCQGALLNNRRVSPGERLEPGDICEVLIDQHGGIDRRLLDLAVTTFARSRIRRALQKGNDGAARGQLIFREVLERRLEAQGAHANSEAIETQVANVCRSRGYQTPEAFYRAVARGEAAPDEVAHAIVEQLLVPRLEFDAVPQEVRARAGRVRLAQCCWPHPPEPALAVAIHGGRQLKIHAAGCARAGGLAYPLGWKPSEEQAYAADVLYESWDRPGLIRRITEAIEGIGAINIRSFHAEVPEPSLARLRFSIEAPRREQIEQVREALLRQPEQRHVELRAVTLIDDGFRITTPLDNPYGPGPVGRWPLFIGRGPEVTTILTQLTGASGMRHILVRGPKRIGKSSLLEHLGRYHLHDFTVPPPLDLQSLPTEEIGFSRLVARISEMIAQKAGTQRARLAPLRAEEIERDPVGAFGGFLAAARSERDLDRFVVLIDEMGVVLSRLRGTSREREFFDQWRALLNDERIYQHLAFVVAMPDYALARLPDEGDGSAETVSRLGELGLPVRLGVLDERQARDLITTPVHSHLAYRPGDLARLLAETGGHPYYTHLVCGQIVTAVQAQQRRTGLAPRERIEVPTAVVDEALRAVLGNRDAFHHVLADSTPATSAVLRAVAAGAGELNQPVSRRRLGTLLRRQGSPAAPQLIERALDERPDLLFEQGGAVGLRVALVTRWLRREL
jgi:GTP diphosphokinase / guanosine-3',5'-bis(diphosphate) 3'-diphosphatase